MKAINNRRSFIKKIGLAGVVATQLPSMLNASAALKDESIALSEGTTFLFQGDSITDGNRTRNNDWNHLMGHGYVYLISSKLWYEYPEKKLTFINKGVSGDRIGDLERRWKEDTLDLKPDVLTILIGINDVIAIMNNNDPESIAVFDARFRRLLDKTRAALPNVKIVLMEPFILPVGWVQQDRTKQWQQHVEMRQALTRTMSKAYQTNFIELQQPFIDACMKAPANYWIWDGIHPMPAGHELMARLWLKNVLNISM